MTREVRGLRLGRHADPDHSIVYDSTSQAKCFGMMCHLMCPVHTPALYARSGARHRAEVDPQ